MQNEIDVGVAIKSKFFGSQDQINATPLMTGKWLVVISKNHPLSKRTSLELKDIASERLIFLANKSNPPLHDAIYQAFAEAGFKSNFIFSTTQPEVTRSFSQQEFGIALGSTFTFQPDYHTERRSQMGIKIRF